MSNIIVRTFTGIFIVGLIISAILISEYFFAGIFLLFAILGLFEFYKICNISSDNAFKFIGIISGIVIYVIISLFALDCIKAEILLLAIPIVFIIFVAGLFKKSENSFFEIAFTIIGIIYIVIPLALLIFIFDPVNDFNSLYPGFLLALFCILWVNDTFAYLVGILIGKNKLFERISPKKTWEGTIGGAVFSIIAAYIISIFYPELNLMEWIFFAIIVVTTGNLGDLVESLLKRNYGQKDSGNILPGHGGILDRFDSLFFAGPFILVFLKFIL